MSRLLVVLYGGFVFFLGVTVLLRLNSYSAPRLIWNWMWLMPVLQLLLVAGVACFAPERRKLWIHLVLTTAIVLGISAAIYLDVFDGMLQPLADVFVHIVQPACWLFVLLGLPAAPFLLRYRYFTLLRLWLMLTAALLVAEPAAWILEPHNHISLDLPESFENPEPGTIHVAAIGGSSTMGHPYQPKFSFSAVVGWRLQDLYPQQKVVVHNLGVGGANLRQAAEELHKLKVRPQLLLIYSGHNEFYHDMEEFRERSTPLSFINPWMNWSALFRISDRGLARNRIVQEFRFGERKLGDYSIASPAVYDERLVRFRDQCRQLSEFCHGQSIQPVWFIPAASEAGFEPNRSGNARPISARENDELEARLQQASRASIADAIELYRTELARYPDFAELHFRLAECLQISGEAELARQEFVQALNLDQHPIRANDDYRQIIRETAQQAHDSLVETIEYLRQQSADGILGEQFFLDNVHMNLRGYYLTGLAGSEVIVQDKLLEREYGPPAPVPPLTLAEAIVRSGLNRDDLAHAYRLTAFGLHELKLWRWDQERRLQQADRFLKMSEQLQSGEIEPGEEGTESLTPD